VTTDVPGCRDAVVANETALLARVRSSEDLARQLCTLLRSEALRLTMGRAGRALAEREFDVTRIVSAIFDVYGAVWPAESVVTARQR
jgi:glycosyltransferase involved in cell wall biosynthesis